MKQNYLFIKLFMLTVMAFFAGNVMADEAVFDFTNAEGLKAMGIPEADIPTVAASAEAGVALETTGPFTVNGVTITAINAGDNQNANRVWSPKGNDGTKYDYRVYGNKDKVNGSLTITAPSGKNISKIVFTTGTWNVPDVSVGDLNVKEWNGNANSLTLTMNAGQCQFKTITVTFADASTIVTKKSADLSFSAEQVELILGETSFTAPTLTKATTAEVKYSSTNEKIATVDEATGAVTITAEAAGTAKIRATTEENDEYYAGQAEYQIIVKEAASGVANIAAMNALENGKEFLFNGKVTVVYASGSYVYIKDDSGSSLLYKKDLGVEKGDVIKAGWEGKVSVYNNLFEVIPSTTLEKDGTAEVTYPEATAADVKAENMNQVVVLKGVTYGDINGKNFKIGSDIAGYNQFGITIEAPEEGATYDIEGVISVFKNNVQFQPISITRAPEVIDITVAPESGDIAEAVAAEAKKVTDGGNVVGNIKIDLTKGGAYTISASIVAPASLTINGNGATIDASALTAAMVTTPTGDLAEWMEGNFTISGVKITGLQKGVYASAGKNYLYNDFKIENSVIELLGTGGFEFDFRKGGVAKNFTIDKSTIYAPTATTNSLYTSQSAQKATEAPGVEVQTFAITNSTLYNLAKSKNFFTHRQPNQKWLAYTLTNSLFVNCGKSGQVVKGVNQGQNGSNPTWSINGNAFNFEDGEGGFKDTSADESTGDEAEPVQNSVAGVMAFTSLETPDFGGVFTLGEGATAPESLGDPRWTINYEKDAPAKLYLITGNWDRTNMIDVPFNNETQAYEYETAPEGKMWFAFADKQLTAEEAEADPNWTDFNTNHRYAIGAGDVNASLNEALPLLKIEGTLVLEPVPAGKVYKISVAKDWSTVTITVEVPTGIQSISADKFAEGEWYTIQGVRVEKPAKGIFIHNGRKYVK